MDLTDTFAAALEALRSGNLIILPTDTVYGIAADVRDEDAVRALYAAKGKGDHAPLQLLFPPDTALIASYAVVTGPARDLIETLGPGGWTVICPTTAGWQSPALAGGSTVGIRIPAATVVHDLARALGAPLAASSANKHGGPSPRTCAEAIAQVGAFVSAALDTGPADGTDSTVIDCAAVPMRILREGAIDRATIARILSLPSIEVVRSVRP